MRLMYVLRLIVLCTISGYCETIDKKMEEEGIVPDLIDEAPSGLLDVTYPGGDKINFGSELTPTQVKDAPIVSWVSDSDKYYTLVMVDPDAPSRQDPKYREIKHWLVVNIKGNDVNLGEVIAEYVGAGPPKGSGLHRYIFLLYEQGDKFDFDEPKSAKTSVNHRINFSVRKFSEKYKLGKPIAANFFNAQWDAYVDIKEKNFTNN